MKVAVIEDNLPVRQLLVRRAEKLDGITVVAQASGEDEAVDAVLATTPDVVLLDLRLAQGTGLSVLSRLRGRRYAGRVFVLSAEDSETYAGLCRRRGADAFYDKAFDFERLLTDLHALCAHDRTGHGLNAGARAVVHG
ncbi:response regulator transcription factor [Mitsuaria sp. GD03876]|uniref:response regulator n=1 Tax=Mitsuaria sp. GD03876 TaxID=2975399 RepID=UPI0024490785|nr:response regulator transcription factor [Mitsuaria sp. GD03876]MDH0863451.1 response regulator transcription factor [Mitsuaria sp. GD03876]